MKKINKLLLGIGMLGLICSSCTTKEEDLGSSNIDASTPVLNETDKWLRDNYTTPYNIEVSYKWGPGKVDLNRYLHPPKIENVKPAMEAIKAVWVEPYSQLGGENFIKNIAPREILLVGGQNINPGGATSVLGLAESGMRIVFFEVDNQDYKDKNQLIQFIGTIQHEYIHILNQRIPFDEIAYRNITPSDYTGQWFEISDAEARELGFISAYARANEHEDFAEMINAMLSSNKADYDAKVNGITSTKAKEDIRKKEAIVVKYYKDNFNIDLYELQELVAKNVDEFTK
ncbi:substrate import-associated zinc metallohydrolase lipoprotein [Tenacibaculum gallaicum]|uniref:Substrate import-associated zinc metallohydrolase lipoprotein n=1 Tax=Tenacibaculum gallaicum TaxID=561505 RepID=A0A3E0ICC6_9FLAO|nr:MULTISPECIES: substrate import-associated zinc metallohydrolase lipoprotein [Tenacibaculum]MDO6674058.1 putative zinc-binding metallopeptidase [Tenacibaculum sp. 1_MG-2023]REH56396.1 substrate import-associated zinc metallohydrolase lipoprotein [Tenacibaculum gallaicum]